MSKQGQSHENFTALTKVERGSDRSFGVVFAAVFVLIGVWPSMVGQNLRLWALLVAAVFLLAAIFYPKSLFLLNLLWTKLGETLQQLVNPVILGVIFYGLFAPLGLLMRARGKYLLRLRFDKSADSYWVAREVTSSEHMERQF